MSPFHSVQMSMFRFVVKNCILSTDIDISKTLHRSRIRRLILSVICVCDQFLKVNQYIRGLKNLKNCENLWHITDIYNVLQTAYPCPGSVSYFTNIQLLFLILCAVKLNLIAPFKQRPRSEMSRNGQFFNFFYLEKKVAMFRNSGIESRDRFSII